MERRGELTTQQIVILIVLVVSFSIILILVFRLDLGETTNKEVCHNSVILRAKSSNLVGDLNCKTSYVCISGGGDCEGINPTSTREIDVNNKTQIMKALADEMADCWWMFGEGEVKYGKMWDMNLQKYVPWEKDYHCAICSVVKFGDVGVDKITYKEFYDYLENEIKAGSQTYLEYLYEVPEVEEYIPAKNGKLDIENGEILTSERYAIVTGMKEDYFINPYFVESDKIVNLTECKVFDITRA